jgi:hypothetical protein
MARYITARRVGHVFFALVDTVSPEALGPRTMLRLETRTRFVLAYLTTSTSQITNQVTNTGSQAIVNVHMVSITVFYDGLL